MANAVEHAYDDGGVVELAIQARERSLTVIVRDHGRGLHARPAGGDKPRYGIPIIESIADEVEFGTAPGSGTEVSMEFRLGAGSDQTGSGPERLETVVRRAVAVVSAQADITVGSLTEVLDVVGFAARSAPVHLLTPTALITIDRLPAGFELRLGPLNGHGARTILSTTVSRLRASALPTTVALHRSRDSQAGGEDLVIGLTPGN